MARKSATGQEPATRRTGRERVDPYEVPDEAPEEAPATKRRRGPNKPKPANVQPKAAESQPLVEDSAVENEEREGKLTNGISQGDGGDTDEQGTDQPVEEPTPVKKRLGRPPGSKNRGGGTPNGKTSTPSAARRKQPAAETPLKLNGLNGIDTPSRRNFADRSARRKSARALIDRVVGDDVSDDEDGIAREIYESSEDDDDDNDDNDKGHPDDQESPDDEGPTAATPSKTPARRGRKPGPGKARKRSPTPPRDLPPQEQYFYHNKPGRAKTSNNTLSALDLLTHDEYFSLLRQQQQQADRHADDVRFLQTLHAESFAQWAFELSQGFSACLYGYGTKRPLLHQFARHLSSSSATTHKAHNPPAPKIVVVNGYVQTTSIRDILAVLGTAIAPAQRLVSGNPVAMAQTLLKTLTATTPPQTIYLVINSIDAPPLRRTAAQAILAQLAAHPQVRLVCSADTPDFHLLWDSGLRSALNFVFHDCTTFAPYGAEVDVVDEVHELLGRLARRAGGKDGVTFVLRSLPENAKSLFRLLVAEVLTIMEDGGNGNGAAADGPGIEYRMLYNKAVEEFICSSEMAFRTLLKEFHDHQIITSHKDSIGTELLSLPFRKEELEGILEDLMS
ncbi:origin recognition complex subunit 2-domain-containing protein [Podospora appendiculata]|uniref:Origin recognition complex subunit 2 n=1 Tax=Podospora appendiculata TaxID=314037 RepID=A0AAE0X5K5_9PEZI|nr:origin recognition complex subunit 2-domain-containing protein [Podospora appendiculata]